MGRNFFYLDSLFFEIKTIFILLFCFLVYLFSYDHVTPSLLFPTIVWYIGTALLPQLIHSNTVN